MNNIIKCVISFGLGLAGGIVGTYIYLQKKQEEEYYEKLRQAIDEECENLRRRHYELEPFGPKKDAHEENVAPKGGTPTYAPPIPPVEIEGVKMEMSENTYQEALKRTGTAFHLTPEDAEEEEDDGGDPEEGMLFGDDDPYQIDRQEFITLPRKYDVMGLTYYVDDGTVLDENDEPVENPWTYIGTVLDDPKPDENGYVYIVAEKEGMGLEVKVVYGSYNPDNS